MSGQLVLGLLTFVGGVLAIIKSLWQFYSVRTAIDDRIDSVDDAVSANRHRIDILELKADHLNDQQTLTINGMREVLNHVRERSTREEEKLSSRVSDMERFLEKTTIFVPRPNRVD